VPPQEHLKKLSPTLKPVYEALDSALHELGPDVTQRSRVGCLKYFAQRKLCDLLIHSNHLSVYVHGLDASKADNSGLVVGGTDRYVHAQIRTIDEVSKLIDLVRPVYEKQAV
jgi:cytolysin (calcineurin-like family phosphatase)